MKASDPVFDEGKVVEELADKWVGSLITGCEEESHVRHNISVLKAAMCNVLMMQESAIREAIEGERERCAKIAEKHLTEVGVYPGGLGHFLEGRDKANNQLVETIASAIRSLRS